MNPLHDKQFLKELDEYQHKFLWAKIVAMDWDENPMEEIIGKSTSGSINVDGTSAVRRTCNLTLVAQDIKINEFYWSLNGKFKVEIGVENHINPSYPDIIWFKQGIFIISSFSCALNVNSYTINIQGKDKMVTLNGEVGGVVPSSWDFRGIDQQAKDGTIEYKLYPIKDIVLQAVHEFAQEPWQNIIVNDLDDYGIELLEYNGDSPLYYIFNMPASGDNSREVFNITQDGNMTCYVQKVAWKNPYVTFQECDPSEYPGPYYIRSEEGILDELTRDYYYSLVDLMEDEKLEEDVTYYKKLTEIGIVPTGEFLETKIGEIEKINETVDTSAAGAITYSYEKLIEELDPSGNVVESKNYWRARIKLEDNDNLFTVAKIWNKNGLQVCGYRITDIVYPYELIASPGETITSVLDKLVKMLGNFEYFYDIDGRFIFQKKKTYTDVSYNNIVNEHSINTEVWADSSMYNSKYSYVFDKNNLVMSVQNNPNISNLKNDYSLWGTRKTGDIEIPIHTRYAIDHKPKFYRVIGHHIQRDEYGLAYKLVNGEKEYLQKWDEETQKVVSINQDPDYDITKDFEYDDAGMIYATEEGWNEYLNSIEEYQKNANLDTDDWTTSMSTAVIKYRKEKNTNGLTEEWWDVQDWARYYATIHAITAIRDRLVTRYNERTQTFEKVELSEVQKEALQVLAPLIESGQNLPFEILEPFYPNKFLMYYKTPKEEYKDFRGTGDVSKLANNKYWELPMYKEVAALIGGTTWQKESSSNLQMIIQHSDGSWSSHGANCTHNYLQLLPGTEAARRNGVRDDDKVYCYKLTFPGDMEYSYDDLDENGQLIIDLGLGGEKENHKIVDWREIIYQMANDYRRHYREDDFLMKIKYNNFKVQKYDKVNNVWEPVGYESWYPSGYTGYENYYVDFEMNLSQGVIAYWRELYDPDAIGLGANGAYNTYGDLKEAEEWVEGTVYPITAVVSYENTYYRSIVNNNNVNPENNIKYWVITDKSKYDDNGWNNDILNNPESLNFWFDFLDTSGPINKYGVQNIGRRTKAVNDTDIKAIYFREVPNVLFYNTETEKTNQLAKNWVKPGYCHVHIPTAMMNLFSLSSRGKNSLDVIDEFLYNYTYPATALNLTVVPIYYLIPNTLIYLNNKEAGAVGEYILQKFSIQLGMMSQMTLNLIETVRRLY